VRASVATRARGRNGQCDAPVCTGSHANVRVSSVGGQAGAGGVDAAGFLRATTPKQLSKIVINTLAPISHAPTRVPRPITDPPLQLTREFSIGLTAKRVRTEAPFGPAALPPCEL
jgi:hypothetical protein